MYKAKCLYKTKWQLVEEFAKKPNWTKSKAESMSKKQLFAIYTRMGSK